MKYLVLISCLFLLGCPEKCEVEETKCNGNKAMICGSNEKWGLSMDCSEVEPKDWEWTCCLDPEDGLHSCLPAEECMEGDE